MVVLLAMAGCGSDSSPKSEEQTRLSELCERTTDRDATYCGCVADEVIKQGYDTAPEIDQLEALVSSIDDSGNFDQLPAPILTALDACEQSTAPS